MMKPIAPLFAALLLAAPAAQAEDPKPSEPLFPSEEEMRELGEMAESWMRGFAERVAPMFEKLRALIDDIDAYEAPEMLPNGDIIIRRKPDAAPRPPAPAPEEPEAGIEL